MLTENDIIEKLCITLKERGYQILQSLSTNDKGYDVIADNGIETIYIEAKGETSSRSNSNRFGKPFTANQIKTHIAVAILASMKVFSSLPAENRTKVGIALPDNKGQRDLINAILPAIERLEIQIFWIK